MDTFDFGFVTNVVPIMFKYSIININIALLAITIGFTIGFLISIVVHAQVPVLTAFFKLYISFFRGTPLIAQLFCFYFGVLTAFPALTMKVSSFQAAVVVLSLSSSAYLAESLRGALSSIHTGQFEAAEAMGMTYLQGMRRIILPQAIRVALPTLFSSFINIVKDTSLVFTIGVKEMMAIAQLEGSSGYRYLEAYVSVLLMFWAITSILSAIQKKLERQSSRTVGE